MNHAEQHVLGAAGRVQGGQLGVKLVGAQLPVGGHQKHLRALEVLLDLGLFLVLGDLVENHIAHPQGIRRKIPVPVADQKGLVLLFLVGDEADGVPSGVVPNLRLNPHVKVVRLFFPFDGRCNQARESLVLHSVHLLG